MTLYAVLTVYAIVTLYAVVCCLTAVCCLNVVCCSDVVCGRNCRMASLPCIRSKLFRTFKELSLFHTRLLLTCLVLIVVFELYVRLYLETNFKQPSENPYSLGSYDLRISWSKCIQVTKTWPEIEPESSV